MPKCKQLSLYNRINKQALYDEKNYIIIILFSTIISQNRINLFIKIKLFLIINTLTYAQNIFSSNKLFIHHLIEKKNYI